MQMNGYFHATADLPPWKQHPVPIGYEASVVLRAVL